MNMDYKYDVFISYSRKDTEVADKICQAFNDANISYFIDRQGIGAGMEFPAVLAKAIKESKVFLFLASKNSYDSKFTQSEIVYAFNKKQKQNIIPYIIDSSTMPDELEFTFSAINWRRMDEHPIETVLVGDVFSIVGKQRKLSEENNLPADSGDLESKQGKIMTAVPYVKNLLAEFNFSGKHLAWIVLVYSILLFLVIVLLSDSYLKAHYSILERIIVISVIVIFMTSVVGIIRPASIALDNRNKVFKFYISSFIIAFITLATIVGYNPFDGNIESTTVDKAPSNFIENDYLTVTLPAGWKKDNVYDRGFIAIIKDEDGNADKFALTFNALDTDYDLEGWVKREKMDGNIDKRDDVLIGGITFQQYADKRPSAPYVYFVSCANRYRFDLFVPKGEYENDPGVWQLFENIKFK